MMIKELHMSFVCVMVKNWNTHIILGWSSIHCNTGCYGMLYPLYGIPLSSCDSDIFWMAELSTRGFMWTLNTIRQSTMAMESHGNTSIYRSGWWFGTFFFSIYWEFFNHKWLYNIFQKGWNQQPEMIRCYFANKTSICIHWVRGFPSQSWSWFPKGSQ